VALTASAVAAPWLELSLRALALTVAPLVAWAAAVKVARAGQARWLQAAVVGAGVLVGGIALCQALGFQVLAAKSASVEEVALEGSSDLYRTFSTLGHKNLVASFCLMCAGAAAGLALAARSWPGRVLGGGAVTVLAAALAVTHSRTGWAVGAALAVLGLLLWGLDRAPLARGVLLRRAGAAAGALAVVGVIGVVGVLRVRPDLVRQGVALASIDRLWNAFNHRGVHWIVAVRMLWHHPLLGVGVGHFGQAYADHLLEALASITDPYRGGTQANQAHSDLLQVAAETGLLGLGAYLALWSAAAVALWGTVRRLAGPERAQAIGLALGIAAFHLTGLLDFPAASPPHTLVLWTLLGLLVGLDRSPATDAPSQSPLPVSDPGPRRAGEGAATSPEEGAVDGVAERPVFLDLSPAPLRQGEGVSLKEGDGILSSRRGGGGEGSRELALRPSSTPSAGREPATPATISQVRPSDAVLHLPPSLRRPAAALLLLLVLAGLWRVMLARAGDRETVAGRRAYQAGDLSRAAAQLERAIADDASLADAYFWRGRIAHRTGDLAGALAHLERSKALLPFYAVDLALGALYLDLRRPADAARVLTRYTRIRPLAPPRDYQLLAEALRQAGDGAGAERAAAMADPARRMELGRQVEGEGKPAEAFEWYLSLQSDEGYLAAIRAAVAARQPLRGQAVLRRIQDARARAEGERLLRQAGSPAG
jgi:O-antigen ligase